MSYFLLDEKHVRFQMGADDRNTVGALLALEQSREVRDVFDAVLYLVNLFQEPGHESLRQAFKELILKVLNTEMARSPKSSTTPRIP